MPDHDGRDQQAVFYWMDEVRVQPMTTKLRFPSLPHPLALTNKDADTASTFLYILYAVFMLVVFIGLMNILVRPQPTTREVAIPLPS